MKYKKWDIVIVKFPFLLAGHKVQKGRPALVISNEEVRKRYDDITLAAITSQVPSEIMELEIILQSGNLTGLVKESLLRLDFIMTVPQELISRKIGVLPKDMRKTVDDKLKKLLALEEKIHSSVRNKKAK